MTLTILLLAMTPTEGMDAVWPTENRPPARQQILDAPKSELPRLFYSKDGVTVQGEASSTTDWYGDVEGLCGLLFPLGTFPLMTSGNGAGSNKTTIGLGANQMSAAQLFGAQSPRATINVRIGVFADAGEAEAAFHAQMNPRGIALVTKEPLWKVPSKGLIPGQVRVNSSDGSTGVVALMGRTYVWLVVTGPQGKRSDDRALALAHAVAFRAAHRRGLTGADPVQSRSVTLKTGKSAECEYVNGVTYVPLEQLRSCGYDCESTRTADDKFADVRLGATSLRFDQFSWTAKDVQGRLHSLAGPAIPYDGDLWVPVDLFSR